MTLYAASMSPSVDKGVQSKLRGEYTGLTEVIQGLFLAPLQSLGDVIIYKVAFLMGYLAIDHTFYHFLRHIGRIRRYMPKGDWFTNFILNHADFSSECGKVAFS